MHGHRHGHTPGSFVSSSANWCSLTLGALNPTINWLQLAVDDISSHRSNILVQLVSTSPRWLVSIADNTFMSFSSKNCNPRLYHFCSTLGTTRLLKSRSVGLLPIKQNKTSKHIYIMYM